jgi:predicted kinase
MPPTLIVMSGLPGCGKTRLARHIAQTLHIPLLSKDRVNRLLRDSGVPDALTVGGYQVILDLADEQLALGLSVILDAAFPRSGFRAIAAQMAARHGARFRPIYCFCSDEAVWKARVENREQYVPGWEHPNWQEVERLRSIFETWTLPMLSVDAAESEAANRVRALAYIEAVLP